MLREPLDEPIDAVDHVDGNANDQELEVPGGPFSLATRVTSSPASAVATEGPPSTAGPSDVAAAASTDASWTAPSDAPVGAATGTAAFVLAHAVRTRPHVGHSPSAASSGAFQNLLQSSHHGNGAALHGQQARPKSTGRSVRPREELRSERDLVSGRELSPRAPRPTPASEDARTSPPDLVRSFVSDCTRGHEKTCCPQEAPLRLLSSWRSWRLSFCTATRFLPGPR